MRHIRAIASVLLLLLKSTSFQAQEVHGNGQKPLQPGVRLQLRPQQSSYGSKQKVSLSVIVSNEGSKPVYIERELGLCPTYWGGLSLTVLDSQEREVPESRCADPHRIDLTGRDVLKAISEHWVLLYPRYSYSYSFTVEGVPARPGRYTLVATLIPPSFTEEEKEHLKSLPHPIFLERLKAPPTIIRRH